MKSIFCTIFLAVGLTVALGDGECGEHEVMNECYNSCNPRTCPNAIKDPQGFCPAVCETEKCDCENGYLRNKCGVCVPVAMCSRPCECQSKDREEIRCVNDCTVRSCSNIIDPEFCPKKFCTEICDCKMGFARNWLGECVLEEECGYKEEMN